MHLSLGMHTLPKSHPVTMIAPNHQGCTLDTMVTPWAELIHRTRITPWAELLSAFQAFTGDDAFVVGNAHITKITSRHHGCNMSP